MAKEMKPLTAGLAERTALEKIDRKLTSVWHRPGCPPAVHECMLIARAALAAPTVEPHLWFTQLGYLFAQLKRDTHSIRSLLIAALRAGPETLDPMWLTSFRDEIDSVLAEAES